MDAGIGSDIKQMELVNAAAISSVYYFIHNEINNLNEF